MKDKILMFVIGALVGAIIATSSLLIYTKLITKNLGMQGNQMQMENNGQMGNMNEPPEKPEENSEDKVQELPEKPNDNISE